MGKPLWLIDDFDDGVSSKLAEEAQAQGHEVRVVEYKNVLQKQEKLKFETNKVIVYGSIPFVRYTQNALISGHWQPGPWCEWKDYLCTNYYAHLGDLILNQNYLMLPFAEVERRKEEFLETFNGNFFLRPNSCAKTFSGKVLTADDFSDEDRTRNTFDSLRASAEDLVVVAPYRTIHFEYRLFVSHESGVIAGSLYMHKGRLQNGSVPKEVVDWVNEKIMPRCKTVFSDPIFVLDIGLTDDKIVLVEPGSFSCAGLYATPLVPLVFEASRLAEKSFKDEYGGTL